MKLMRIVLIAYLISNKIALFAQQQEPIPDSITLEQVIAYTLKNQPLIRQSQLDEEIAEREIRVGLAGWMPQLGATGRYQHYLRLPVAVFPNVNVPGGPPQIIQIGLKNTSNMLLQLDQTLFSNDLLFASKGARYLRQQAKQVTENNKINAVVEASKAFYDILTSVQQLSILNENITRLEKQLKDAYAQYEAGLVDKTDYKRATITLANTRADRKRTEEALKYKYAYLKQLMGLDNMQKLSLAFDTGRMEQHILLDTLQPVQYESRVEYRRLMTQKQIQKLNISYYRMAILPELSGFLNYNFVYQNNEFSKLFRNNYPNSIAGLSLSMPIFQGNRRLQNLRREKLEDQRLDLEIQNLRNAISTEYEQAMAIFKSNLNDWKTARENVALSREVYNTIKLQYDEGIKTYLDLMVAESDLRTTQINYLNALFSVLSGKIDVQRVLGNIQLN